MLLISGILLLLFLSGSEEYSTHESSETILIDRLIKILNRSKLENKLNYEKIYIITINLMTLPIDQTPPIITKNTATNKYS
jgi:hypothetical protein